MSGLEQEERGHQHGRLTLLSGGSCVWPCILPLSSRWSSATFKRQEMVLRPGAGSPPALQVLQAELAVPLAHRSALTLQVLRAVACAGLLQLLTNSCWSTRPVLANTPSTGLFYVQSLLKVWTQRPLWTAPSFVS